MTLKHPQSPERSELHLDLAIRYPKLIGERLLIEPMGLLGRNLKNGKRHLQAVFIPEQPLREASHLLLFRCRDIFHLIRMEICRLPALSDDILNNHLIHMEKFAAWASIPRLSLRRDLVVGRLASWLGG